MTDVVERIGSSFFRLRTEQHVKPKPRDILRFDVKVTVQYYAYFLWIRLPTRASTLFHMTIPIRCENFFQDNHDFLPTFLSNSLCSPFFTPQIIDQISQRFVYRVQQLLDFPSAHSECQQEFPLTLDIEVDVVESEVAEDIEESAVIEESMQQSVTMIPASNEAINCLKTFTDSLFLKSEICNICMDKFQAEEDTDEDVKLLSSSMPCGHVFHQQCIVKWLQTSHTCPLCRYSVPTAKD